MGDAITYQREYIIRRAHKSQNRTVEVTMPLEEIEREARTRGMTIDEFIEKFKTLCEWGDGKGIRYTFIEKDGTEQPR